MDSKTNSGFLKKFKLFILSIGPGLFIIGYNIGTGSVTTMAATGAEYGMMLAWPLLLSCIFTYILIVVFGKYTVVTGDTVIHSYRKYFGKPVALFVLIALLFSEAVSSIGVMAIVTQVVQEWSRPLTESGEGINPIYSALVFGAILYALFWNGRQRFFEKVLAVFVGLMGASFLLTMFMVIPDPIEIITGLVPKMPEDSNASLLIAGMVGTTMGAVIYVVRSILIKGKGWTLKDFKLEKRDAIISASLMFFLSIAVMASAAGTLHPLGLKVDNAIDMVNLLEPLAGRFALSIFVVGIVAAGLSSLFPIIILAPWLIADYKNEIADMQSSSARWMVFGVLSLGLIVPIFGGRPVLVMIASQAFITVVTPLVIGLMLILLNRKSLMGEHALSTFKNILVGVTLLFSIAMALLGIIGILGL
ncbi:MAG: Nramp family divalent metal transporter [Balneolaceae bacterium]